jgi:hypothetical protein
MRKSRTSHGERVVKDIKRKTRKQYSAETWNGPLLINQRGKSTSKNPRQGSAQA